MGSKRGDVNGWVCPDCKGVTYAVHVDEGVTPFYLGCRFDWDGIKECNGMARSLFYPPPPVPQHVIEAIAWEWFRPGDPSKLDEAMREHVEKGGLDIRPLTDEGKKALAATPTEQGDGEG